MARREVVRKSVPTRRKPPRASQSPPPPPLRYLHGGRRAARKQALWKTAATAAGCSAHHISRSHARFQEVGRWHCLLSRDMPPCPWTLLHCRSFFFVVLFLSFFLLLLFLPSFPGPCFCRPSYDFPHHEIWSSKIRDAKKRKSSSGRVCPPHEQQAAPPST